MIGLLAVTGTRRGEALALDHDDFDPDTGVLIVRAGKFGKSRELPLHPTTVAAVTAYLQRHDRPQPVDPTEHALLLSENGRRYSPNTANHTFHALAVKAGLRPRSERCRPRQHDLATRWPSERCWMPTGPGNRPGRGSSLCPPISGIMRVILSSDASAAAVVMMTSGGEA